jgi:hypothetical protein
VTLDSFNGLLFVPDALNGLIALSLRSWQTVSLTYQPVFFWELTRLDVGFHGSLARGTLDNRAGQRDAVRIYSNAISAGATQALGYETQQFAPSARRHRRASRLAARSAPLECLVQRIGYPADQAGVDQWQRELRESGQR